MSSNAFVERLKGLVDDRLVRLGVLLLAVGAVAYATRFGLVTQDDAFISFRYAEHFVAGHGLVYNPGDWVEGYSNPLWTLMLAGGMFLGMNPVGVSVFLGAVALLLLLCALGEGFLRYMPADWSTLSGARLWALVAVGLLSVESLLLLEAVEGLETVFYALLLLLAFLFALREHRLERAHWGSGVCLALAVLTRPEAPLLVMLLHFGLLGTALVSKDGLSVDAFRLQLRRSLLGLLPVAAAVIVLVGLRLAFYGEWLPNTYFAKTGAGADAIPRGIYYLKNHVLSHPVLWGLVVIRWCCGRWRPSTWMASSLVIGMTAYIVWVGGDFKPTGRFFVPVLPMMAWLAGEVGLVLLARRWAGLAFAICLAAGSVLMWMGPKRAAFAQRQAAERHANFEARRLVGEWLNQTLPTDAVIAIHSAGAIPFYAKRKTIDMWGLSDKHIARTLPPHMGQGMAGHEKTDPDYVFALSPEVYLPEDKVFALKPWTLQPDPSFSPDFAAHYRSVSQPIEGRWLNFWVRRDWAFANTRWPESSG